MSGIAGGNLKVTMLPTLSIPVDATPDQFIEFGRNLRHLVETSGFLLGDYALAGRERFGDQFDLILDEAGLDKKAIAKSAHVAKAFPAALRNKSLSFEHHRAVLKLPRPEQLNLLKQADDQRWKPQKLREAVVQRRYECGDDFPPDEVDSAMLTVIVRAWNRATAKARDDFLILAKACKGGVIDEEKIYD